MGVTNYSYIVHVHDKLCHGNKPFTRTCARSNGTVEGLGTRLRQTVKTLRAASNMDMQHVGYMW